MNVEQLYKELFAEVHTVTESWDFIHQIDQLSESLFSTKQTFEEKLDQYLEFTLKNNIVMLLEKTGVDSGDANAVEKFLADLKERIKALPIFELEIAYEPNSTTIKHVAEWVYFNLHQNVLLDVKIKPELVGGAIFGFNGKMGDFSLKRKLEEKYAVSAPAQAENPVNNGSVK